MRRLLASLLACAALSWVDVASALPPTTTSSPTVATLVVIRGAGAEDCPTADGFAERVDAISASHILQTSARAAGDTWIYLEITHDLRRYTALLQLRGRQQGSRGLSDVSASCASLADAVSVTLALLLDADQHPARPEPDRRPVSIGPPKARLEPKESRYAVVLGGGVGLGVMAQPAVWATLGVEALLGPRFRVAIGGAVALPQRVHYLQGYTELNLIWGYARGCAVAVGSKSELELMLCLSPMVGVLSGSGERYDFSSSKSWIWIALGGGPQLSGPLATPSFWWLSALAIAPLTLRGFAISVDGKPHDTFVTSGVAAMASLGMGVRF